MSEVKKALLNAGFTIQKQAEEIAKLHAEIITLRSTIDRAYNHLTAKHYAVAEAILEAKKED